MIILLLLSLLAVDTVKVHGPYYGEQCGVYYMNGQWNKPRIPCKVAEHWHDAIITETCGR